MNYWETIVKAATVGLNRIPVEPDDSWPDWAQELSEGARTDEAVLRIAGAQALARKGGFEPVEVPTSAKQIEAPDETKPAVGQGAGVYLEIILDIKSKALLREYLTILNETGKSIPPGALPTIFRLVVKEKWPIKGIRQAMGERGQWLASLNNQWKIFLPVAESDWETGSMDDRLRYLLETRKANPEQARELLETVQSKEIAPNLLRFLGVMRTNISAADEGLLESLLQHPRAEIRKKTAELLMLIPQSNWTSRMQARLLALIRVKRSLIATEGMEIYVPAEMNPEMQRDGVAENPYQGIGLGVKASWLAFLTAAPPLSWWQKAYKTKPARLVELVQKTDWKKPVMLGWIVSHIHQPQAEWSKAILPVLLRDKDLFDFVPQGLLDRFAATVPDEIFSEQVGKAMHDPAVFDENNLALRLVLSTERPLDLPLAQQFLMLLNQSLLKNRNSPGIYLRNQVYHLRELALRLPVELLAEVSELWREEADEWAWYYKHTTNLMDTLAFRAEMREAIHQNTVHDE